MENAPQKDFSIFLRIPGWAEDSCAIVNGKLVSNHLESEQYFEIRRSWSTGDQIKLVLPMTAQLLEAHPLVEEARNRVTARRRPIVYCLESIDLPDTVGIMKVAISPTTQFQIRSAKELLGGVMVLEGKARVLFESDWGKTLYRKISLQEPKTIDVRLIPYYAWGNRGDSEMTVWIPLR